MALSLSSKSLKGVLETKQGKTYTVFGITIMTVVFMFMFAIRPAWVSITNKLSENATKRQYINDAETKLSNLNVLSQEYLENKSSIDYLEQYYLPQYPTESFVIGNITAITQKHGVKIKFIKIEPPELFEGREGALVGNADILSQSSIFLTLEGNLDNTQNLIADLESMGKIIDIETITFGTLETEEGFDGTWQISIQGNIYFWDIQNFKERENV